MVTQEMIDQHKKECDEALKGIKGPWENEPHRVEFEHLGFNCLLVRNLMGNWCGYVGVPPGHPWFEKNYNDLYNVDVHGGLTYSAHCHGTICHLTESKDKIWWVGFDTAHLGDLSPKMVQYQQREDWPKSVYRDTDIYRDVNYTRQETMSLAQQAFKAET